MLNFLGRTASTDGIVLDYSTEGVFSIINVTGKVINTQNLVSDKSVKKFQMDISGFNSGLYFVNFRTSSSTHTQKLVINNKN